MSASEHPSSAAGLHAPPFERTSMKLLHSVVVGDGLAVAFDDGSEWFLPLVELRRHCPCAACRDAPNVTSSLVPGSAATTLAEVRLVGAYALLLFWQDGHSSGIHSYDHLADLGRMLGGSPE